MSKIQVELKRPSHDCSMGQKYIRFLKNRDGASAVEFALVSFPFLGLVLASMSIGLTFVYGASLDFAVEKAARSMATGNIQSNQISASQYQNSVFCPMLSVAFDCSKIVINVLVERKANAIATTTGYSDLANANQTALLVNAYTSAGSATFCTGQPGDYVYIQVLYPMSALLSFVSPTGSVATIDGKPAFLLDSTLAFKNEQFPSNSTGC